MTDAYSNPYGNYVAPGLEAIEARRADFEANKVTGPQALGGLAALAAVPFAYKGAKNLNAAARSTAVGANAAARWDDIKRAADLTQIGRKGKSQILDESRAELSDAYKIFGTNYNKSKQLLGALAQDPNNVVTVGNGTVQLSNVMKEILERNRHSALMLQPIQKGALHADDLKKADALTKQWFGNNHTEFEKNVVLDLINRLKVAGRLDNTAALSDPATLITPIMSTFKP